jgi:hypothetical protein
MLPIQVVIIALTISVAMGVFFYFFRQNKKLEAYHLQQILLLEKELILCASQIKTRHKELDKYHFLKYNLTEALIFQPEIHI